MYRSIGLALLLLLTGTATARAADAGSWKQLSDPAASGWSVEKLEEARARAQQIGSAAVMVVDHGHVVAAWGDVERRFRSHSLRKSLISAMYGPAVAAGKIDLDATLGELGIDDLEPLTSEEKLATVHDLLSARSGVYHPAGKVTAGQVAKRPKRGSHPHGTHWFYNNWDFNVAGVLLAGAIGDPGEAFARSIAGPAGMEDFRARDFQWEHEPRTSRHPAFDFRISSRDLARLGEVYRTGGTWNGRRVLDESWIRRSTSAITRFADGSGYGYMWWVSPETSSEFGMTGEPSGSFAAMGAGAQILYVLPSKGLVIVHRGNTDGAAGVDESKALALIAAIVRAKTGETAGEPRLRAMHARPLGDPLPPLDDSEPLPVGPDLLAKLPGWYTAAPGPSFEIYAHERMLFISTAGRPDVRLFPTGPDTLESRTVPLTVSMKRSADGSAEALEITFQGRKMSAVRTPPAQVEKPDAF